MPWEDPELPDDEDEIIQRILDRMADALPGWEPHEGAPEVALAEEIGRETAVLHARAVDVLRLAIAGIGETVFQFPSSGGTFAVLPVVTLAITPAGPIQDVPGGEQDLPFSLSAGFTIVAGDAAFTLLDDITETVHFTLEDTTWRGEMVIAMTATAGGSAGNVEAGTATSIITNTGTVISAEITEDGAGGGDGEPLVDYLSRLADYLPTLRPGTVRADDLVVFARGLTGVHRAMAIDLYDPEEEDPQERTATVFAIDETGQPVSGPDEVALEAQLEATREVNFDIIIGDPIYTPIDVEVEVEATVDEEDLEVLLTAAIAAYIDPATWGITAEDPRAWVERLTLRAMDVAIVVAGVTGVASVVSATVNGGATVTLDGPAALPAPVGEDPEESTITVAFA